MTTLIKQNVPAFAGFGSSLLTKQTRFTLASFAVPKDRLQARAMLHDHCPLTPGVYGWLDNNQQICYIGKSKSLRKRLLTYFAKTPADKKAQRIREHSETLVWEPMSDELLALIREQELIYRWRPEFNTQGQPTKRQPAFICISNSPAPNAFFTRRVSAKASHTFGPISGTGHLRAAVDSINQVFRLRDCPDKTKFEYSDQQQLFVNPQTPKCIRFELGSCPAPCAAHCSHSNYGELVQQAVDFIKGTDISVLNSLDAKMQTAGQACSFERAAILRDHLKNLKWFTRRMKDLRSAQRNYNGIFPVPGLNNRNTWLILKGGQIMGSVAEPRTERQSIAAIKQLTEIASQKQQLPASILEMNLQLIIISWFRKYTAVKKTLVSFDDAIEVCESRLGSSSGRPHSSSG